MTTLQESSQLQTQTSWTGMARIALKAAVLFVIVNLAFAVIQPVEALGRVSLYGTLIPPRLRLPYGENPAASNSLSLNSLPAMFASHAISRPKAPDEFRVVLLGDSQTWGWLRTPDETLTQINGQGQQTPDGRRVVVYNLGYPVLSLTKDLLILDEALRYQPDLIVWIFTLQSFGAEAQYSPLVLNNVERIEHIAEQTDLSLDLSDPRFERPDFFGQTLIGQRRSVADWLRLQLYGFGWWTTGIDQAIPETFTPRANDLDADTTWDGFDGSQPLTAERIAFDVLYAGLELAADVPLVWVNEPIYVADGANSDLRYNSFYPRWAYDQFRDLLLQESNANGVTTLDAWNVIAPDQFTDTPVHLTAEASAQWSLLLADWLAAFAYNG